MENIGMYATPASEGKSIIFYIVFHKIINLKVLDIFKKSMK
jgi:hypothetical protein